MESETLLLIRAQLDLLKEESANLAKQIKDMEKETQNLAGAVLYVKIETIETVADLGYYTGF